MSASGPTPVQGVIETLYSIWYGIEPSPKSTEGVINHSSSTPCKLIYAAVPNGCEEFIFVLYVWFVQLLVVPVNSLSNVPLASLQHCNVAGAVPVNPVKS